MKRFMMILLSVLFALPALGTAVSAADKVVYLSYSNGNNNNSGLTADQPKRGLGSSSGEGAAGVISKGGTLVITEKMYIGTSAYTWMVGGPAVFTANYGGKDYMVDTPANNPSGGVIKMQPGAILTIMSDVTMRDLILFQDDRQDTIIVSGGATLRIDESVKTMTNTGTYMKIVVARGSKAVINGGTFDSVTGDGTIEIGSSATVLNDGTTVTETAEIKNSRSQRICYVNGSKGKDTNDGTTADLAVKSVIEGVFERLPAGGTAVVTTRVTFGASATASDLPLITKPIVFTAVYGEENYREEGSVTIASSATINVYSDIVFDDIVISVSQRQPTLVLKPGVTLTITDKAEMKLVGTAKLRLKMQEGSYAHIPDSLKDMIDITGYGTVISYVNGDRDIIEYVLGEGVEIPETAAPGSTDAPDTTAEPDTSAVPGTTADSGSETAPGGQKSSLTGIIIGAVAAVAAAAVGVIAFLKKKKKN